MSKNACKLPAERLKQFIQQHLAHSLIHANIYMFWKGISSNKFLFSQIHYISFCALFSAPEGSSINHMNGFLTLWLPVRFNLKMWQKSRRRKWSWESLPAWSPWNDYVPGQEDTALLPGSWDHFILLDLLGFGERRASSAAILAELKYPLKFLHLIIPITHSLNYLK